MAVYSILIPAVTCAGVVLIVSVPMLVVIEVVRVIGVVKRRRARS